MPGPGGVLGPGGGVPGTGGLPGPRGRGMPGPTGVPSPMGVPGPGGVPGGDPQRWLLLRAVRILLECILVHLKIYLNKSEPSHIKLMFRICNRQSRRITQLLPS